MTCSSHLLSHPRTQTHTVLVAVCLRDGRVTCSTDVCVRRQAGQGPAGLPLAARVAQAPSNSSTSTPLTVPVMWLHLASMGAGNKAFQLGAEGQRQPHWAPATEGGKAGVGRPPPELATPCEYPRQMPLAGLLFCLLKGGGECGTRSDPRAGGRNRSST